MTTPTPEALVFIFDAGYECDAQWSDLARRQQTVALCVARGMTNEQIADRLGIAVSTVVNTMVRVNQIIGLAEQDSNHRVALTLWVLEQINRNPSIVLG